ATVTSASGNVTLTATAGSILDDNNDATVVTGNTVALTALNTIGAPFSAPAVEDIDTDAVTVNATTTATGANNGIWVTDIRVGTFNTAPTADGVVVLESAGTMTVGTVTAGGTGRNARLRTTGPAANILLGVVNAAGDGVRVEATGAVTDNNAAANNVT